MTTRRAVGTLILLGALIAGAWFFLSRPRDTTPGHAGTTTARALVGTMRSDPPTFNRFVSSTFQTHLVSFLTQAPLVRINPVKQELEPWLADRWTRSDDGLRYRLHLREGVTFSDGHPFTADDVVFSFRAAYDAATKSPLGDSIRVGQSPLTVTAAGPSEVDIAFPRPSGPGLRLLDAIPIYPKHLLEASLDAGRFRDAWATTTPPAQMAGLGPFVLESYQPGERLVFVRNRHYWRTDDSGQPLPRLDRLTLEVVPSQDAELLRLRAGQVDMIQSEVRAEDYQPVKADADLGRLKLTEVGTALDTYWLWLNLVPDAHDQRPWLRTEAFRHAISRAIDRQQFIKTVYLGAAVPGWGPVSPANRNWYETAVAVPAYDPAQARALLAGLGLRDRNGDGLLDDDKGQTVRFNVLVARGLTAGEKGVAVLKESLAKIGVGVDVSAVDLGALQTRFGTGDYDAIYNRFEATDTDPAGNMDLWLSSGGFHVWNPGQSQPATDWERQIDELMARQASTLDITERRHLFSQAQQLLAAHEPLIVFAFPRVFVAVGARVGSVLPSVQRPQLLWSPDTLSVTAVH